MDVYCASPWIPPEWIAAHGFRPRALWCHPGFRLDDASAAAPPGNSLEAVSKRRKRGLQAGMCAFSEAVTELPRENSAGLYVYTSHCDQLRRAYDTVRTGRDTVFLLNLPATWESEAARLLISSELKRLSRFLVSRGGYEPGELDRLATERESARIALRSLAGQCWGRRYAEIVSRFHWQGFVEAQSPPPLAVRPEAARLALLGGPLPSCHWDVFEWVQGAGGEVVLNATENGERSLGLPTRATCTDPGEALLDRMVDVWQRPNTRLYCWLGEKLKERAVQGILLWHFSGCDLWRAETQSLREAFGLPVMPVETGESTGSARNRNRVEALVEMLR